MSSIDAMSLGQVGYRFTFGRQVIYVDPYLSDSVAQIDGPAFERLFPVLISPEKVTDANWVLITHEHIDHCDPLTLGPLAKASPQARFICPSGVKAKLQGLNISEKRIVTPVEGEWNEMGISLKVAAVPAAHPDINRDELGYPRCLGFVIDYEGRRLYHAGDTSPHEEVLRAVKGLGPIDIAFLPVNERNFFRDRMGIIGNMSVREAFLVAQEIGAKSLVPMHWDMFNLNSVAREEIELLYRLLAPQFSLEFYPSQL